MKNWEQTLIEPDAPLREALEKIDRAGTRMVLVVDSNCKLIGTLSDGDIRRGLLRGLTLSDKASSAVHSKPTVARQGEERESILATMRLLGLFQVPIVDAQGIVVGLETIDDLLATTVRDQWVVIMAGGRGIRMAELTRDTPKPMLKVGSRPLLESIITRFAGQGFRRFYLAVNYRADQIEAHFGDGSAFGIKIDYLRESEPMGTAGALGLLPEMPSLPVIVSNADLLTKEDYGSMLDRHMDSGADGTMAVRNYDMQVPFGVVREHEGGIEAIEEKPFQRFVVNAGIYVLSPRALTLVPRSQPFDMPALFTLLMNNGMQTRCHHIDGYWLDIGRPADYERANIEFAKLFH